MRVEHWWNYSDRGKSKYCTRRDTCFIALCQPQVPRTCGEQSGLTKSMPYVDIMSVLRNIQITMRSVGRTRNLCVLDLVVHKITRRDFKGEYTMLASMLKASAHRHTCTRINVVHPLTSYLFYSLCANPTKVKE